MLWPTAARGGRQRRQSRNRLFLGEPVVAAAHFHRSLETALSDRNSATYRAHLAAALATSGDITGAVAIASGDPFDSVEAFMHRFDSYTTQTTFDLVVAYRAAEAIGQTWGWPLTENSRFWEGLLTELESGFTNENGRRTFALSEIMVSQEWTGKGVAHTLHDQLLSDRAESRAALLVEPDNTTAYRAYLHWGWSKVAQLRPDWENAPTFDVLILPLNKM